MNKLHMKTRYTNPERFEERPAFLYTIYQNALCCRPGVISIDKEKKLGGRFYVKSFVKTSIIDVDDLEGVMWNRAVWFYEKSDEKARKIFTDYEQECIQELERKIKQHKEILCSLEEMTVGSVGGFYD